VATRNTDVLYLFITIRSQDDVSYIVPTVEAQARTL
jgi:hypothetical protein